MCRHHGGDGPIDPLHRPVNCSPLKVLFQRRGASRYFQTRPMMTHHRRDFSQRRGRHASEKSIIQGVLREAPSLIDRSYFHFLSGCMHMQGNQYIKHFVLIRLRNYLFSDKHSSIFMGGGSFNIYAGYIVSDGGIL